MDKLRALWGYASWLLFVTKMFISISISLRLFFYLLFFSTVVFLICCNLQGNLQILLHKNSSKYDTIFFLNFFFLSPPRVRVTYLYYFLFLFFKTIFLHDKVVKNAKTFTFCMSPIMHIRI